MYRNLVDLVCVDHFPDPREADKALDRIARAYPAGVSHSDRTLERHRSVLKLAGCLTAIKVGGNRSRVTHYDFPSIRAAYDRGTWAALKKATTARRTAGQRVRRALKRAGRPRVVRQNWRTGHFEKRSEHRLEAAIRDFPQGEAVRDEPIQTNKDPRVDLGGERLCTGPAAAVPVPAGPGWDDEAAAARAAILALQAEVEAEVPPVATAAPPRPAPAPPVPAPAAPSPPQSPAEFRQVLARLRAGGCVGAHRTEAAKAALGPAMTFLRRLAGSQGLGWLGTCTVAEAAERAQQLGDLAERQWEAEFGPPVAAAAPAAATGAGRPAAGGKARRLEEIWQAKRRWLPRHVLPVGRFVDLSISPERMALALQTAARATLDDDHSRGWYALTVAQNMVDGTLPVRRRASSRAA